jgi:DNA polymerase lambda/DNA polymerase IV
MEDERADYVPVPQSPDLAMQPASETTTQHLQRQDSGADELSDYISLLQQYKDLPLDDEDDDIQSVKSYAPVSDEESGSDVGSMASQPVKKKRTPQKAGQKAITHEDRFACHTGGTKDATATSTNPNARTIEVLQSMSDYYARTNDHWRTTAYRRAITTLKQHPTRITTAKEAYLLPNVGPRLAAKIEEIVTTNKLQRLDEASSDPTSPILELFLKIYGVGIAQASKWVSQGHRTLDDLLAHVNLSTNQRIGIEHFEDLNTRIPRAEVGALAAHVRRTAHGVDSAVELLVGGSYRRGADSSGDIDFIVTKKGTTSETDLVPFLDETVARLTNAGFLVAALAVHKQGKGGEVLGGSKWHGCCVLPMEEGRAALGEDFTPRWRRIDFLLVPESQYGAALIYFTGNDIFNRSIRLLASKKGMRLNQRGLFRDVIRGPNRVKVTEGELVEGRDEKKIFEILGVKWREPKDRWC